MADALRSRPRIREHSDGSMLVAMAKRTNPASRRPKPSRRTAPAGSKRFALDTLAIHAAQDPDPVTGAIMPAIQLSTTFAQDGPGRHRGFEYARTDNPTRRTLEQCVATLEGGRHGIAFAS